MLLSQLTYTQDILTARSQGVGANVTVTVVNFIKAIILIFKRD